MQYRPANPDDELYVIASLSKLLGELEGLGHDVLPTEHNVSVLWSHVLAPALLDNAHGIYLAFDGPRCVGASLFAPEVSAFDTPTKRAVAYGIWVEPDYRRQGIAHQLQLQAHEKLAQSGFRELISNVVINNVAGLESAKSAGARIVGYMTSVDLGGS